MEVIGRTAMLTSVSPEGDVCLRADLQNAYFTRQYSEPLVALEFGPEEGQVRRGNWKIPRQPIAIFSMMNLFLLHGGEY